MLTETMILMIIYLALGSLIVITILNMLEAKKVDNSKPKQWMNDAAVEIKEIGDADAEEIAEIIAEHAPSISDAYEHAIRDFGKLYGTPHEVEAFLKANPY